MDLTKHIYITKKINIKIFVEVNNHYKKCMLSSKEFLTDVSPKFNHHNNDTTSLRN